MPIEFRDVSLTPLSGFRAKAPSGAIIGVIGETGSGVTELLKLASGELEPEQGQVMRGMGLSNSEVIALDHALALQDAVARAQTLIELDRLRRSGAIVFLASHEAALLESVCDEVWWVDAGELAAKGDPRETLARYRRHIAEKVRTWGETISSKLAPSFRRGDQRAEVISIQAFGQNQKPTLVWKSGEMVGVRVEVGFHETVSEPVLGLLIRTQIGFEVYGTNTGLERVKIGPRAAGDTVVVKFEFLCDLCPRAYTLTVASHDPDGTAHDWLDDAIAITVVDERETAGVANLRAKVTVDRTSR